MVRIGVVVLVTACWSTSQPAPAPAPAATAASAPIVPGTYKLAQGRSSCGASLERTLEKLRDELARTGMTEPVIEAMRAAAVESCETMQWSAELLACYDGASDTNEVAGCQPLMTAEQSEDVTRRMMEVVSRMHGQLSPPPPPPTGP